MKAIALDMDGTVLNDRGELSEKLTEVLTAMNDTGIKIIFATGRTQSEILKAAPSEIDIAGYVAASGMSVFIDDELVAAQTFSDDVVHKLLAKAREHEIYYETYTATGSGRTLLEDREYSVRDLSADAPRTMLEFENILLKETLQDEEQWVDSLKTGQIIKVFFISKDLAKIDRWYAYLESVQVEMAFALYKTSRHNCEVMLAGHDKATGLKILLNHYDLSFEDVHAIGDSMNDLPMFKVCGHVTAMKNSTDDVLSAADDVTEFTNDEDGLAHYLEKMYLK